MAIDQFLVLHILGCVAFLSRVRASAAARYPK